MKNRIKTRLQKTGNSNYLQSAYKQSKELRFIKGFPLFPIAYVQPKFPRCIKANINMYTPEGRKYVYNNLQLNYNIINNMIERDCISHGIQYMDNRISLYTAQKGKCAITGKYLEADDINCHHKIPIKLGGNDDYDDLIILRKNIHKLIHATEYTAIDKHIRSMNLTEKQILKINKLCKIAKLNML